MLDILKKLVNTVSVSGNEGEISNVIQKLTEKYADEITKDALGNLTVLKKSKKKNAKKIMIASHMDEIGFIVTFIDDSGYIK